MYVYLYRICLCFYIIDLSAFLCICGIHKETPTWRNIPFIKEKQTRCIVIQYFVTNDHDLILEAETYTSFGGIPGPLTVDFLKVYRGPVIKMNRSLFLHAATIATQGSLSP